MNFLVADVRLEEFVYEKLEKKAPTRMNNHELLGQAMIDSGSEFSPGTAYGGCADSLSPGDLRGTSRSLVLL